ncbi:tRNA (adenosine(37)-N6)-threonylcarbamoyltransferase complex ATPase subunit type 1 TsaE [bacterium]|nr:tRNA (adenosine(37)-N6)-threonylcarbamoyltransferase complex ATPase subunit type 1 TsaE [bacterium]
MMPTDMNVTTMNQDERVGAAWHRFETYSPVETERVAEEFARSLKTGDVAALNGELGTGKTTFIRGVCRGLQVSAQVTSPTFTLIHEYQGSIPVYHFDFYRITNPIEIVQLGCDEYFCGDGICLIEWAERVSNYLPENRFEVHLKHRFGQRIKNSREILIRRT